MTKCVICKHPRRTEIECDIVSGLSIREIGKKYDLDSHLIQKHKMPENGLPSHISESVMAAFNEKKMENGRKLMDRIDEVYDISLELVNMAVNNRDPRSAAYCLSQTIRLIEILANMPLENTQNAQRTGLMQMRESLREMRGDRKNGMEEPATRV